MSNKVISIDIGLHTTRICEVDYKKKNPKVYYCISYPTPEDVFEDGFIRNKEKFVEIAKERIQEARIRTNKVVFTVASSKIANREVVIPYVKASRIKDIIEANASDYFPVEISEYTIAYHVLEKIEDESGKHLRLSVLAAPYQLIKNYYSVAELLGYEVEAIDYLGNSIIQSCKGKVASEIAMIAQIQEESTLLSILEGGVLTLQRTIQYGTESIINTLIQSEYHQLKDEEEALDLLSSNALINRKFLYNQEVAATVGNGLEEAYDKREEKKKEELTETLYHLVNNILRVLDYYSSKNVDKKIGKIYLTGQGSKIKGFDELLNNEIGIEVETIKDLYGIKFDKNIMFGKENQGDYLASIGATINPLNFMPKEYLHKVEKKSLAHTRIVVLIGSILISILLVLTSYLECKTEILEKNRLETEISGLEDVLELYDLYKESNRKHTTIKTMYDLTKGYNDNLGSLIIELEEKLPKTSTISSMNITYKEISLNINTDSKATAAKTLMQLKTIKPITQVMTTKIVEVKEEGGNVTVSFTVTAQYQSNLEEESNGLYK